MVQAIFAPETIVLFEPQADFREKLIRRQPAEAKWKVIPVALGDQEGTQWINVTENSAASSLLTPMTAEVPASWGTTPVRREEVKVATLDGSGQNRRAGVRACRPEWWSGNTLARAANCHRSFTAAHLSRTSALAGDR